jgi:SAM-dependent methyltransferase
VDPDSKKFAAPPVTYCDGGTDFDDVIRHLRNKNIAVYPRRWSAMLKMLHRLHGEVTKLRLRALRRAGWQAVVSEQIVESGLILRYVRPEERRVLDFGGYESVLPLTLSALGHEVTVLDQRPYPFKAPGLKGVTADLFGDHALPPESFDLVISVSTIEHLGLGRYDDREIPDGDRLGVERLWRLVRPGGRLMATVPAGRPTVQRGYRTYDEARVRAVFPPLDTLLWFKKDGRGCTWTAAQPGDIASLTYGEPFAEMPAEAVAFVIARKPTR